MFRRILCLAIVSMGLTSCSTTAENVSSTVDEIKNADGLGERALWTALLPAAAFSGLLADTFTLGGAIDEETSLKLVNAASKVAASSSGQIEAALGRGGLPKDEICSFILERIEEPITAYHLPEGDKFYTRFRLRADIEDDAYRVRMHARVGVTYVDNQGEYKYVKSEILDVGYNPQSPIVSLNFAFPPGVLDVGNPIDVVTMEGVPESCNYQRIAASES